MADEFDLFLARELAPAEGAADRAFVGRVQARIALEERLTGQQRAMVLGLLRQMVAVAAVGAGLVLIGSAGPLVRWFAESPATGLAVILTGFVLLGVVLATSSSTEEVPLFARPGLSMP